jgi:hypothetical protein
MPLQHMIDVTLIHQATTHYEQLRQQSSQNAFFRFYVQSAAALTKNNNADCHRKSHGGAHGNLCASIGTLTLILYHPPNPNNNIRPAS